MRRVVIAVTALLVLTVTAGCTSGENSANPTPSSTPSSSVPVADAPATTPPSTGPTLPYAGAPKVANPLPASVLSGDPCTDALIPDQVKQALGTTVQGEPDTLPTGPYCSWFNRMTSGRIAVGYPLNNHQGLSAIYANTKPKVSTWKELPLVEDFPSVAYDFTPLDCTVTVGLADDLSIDVSGFLSSAKQQANADPCEATANAAAVIVGNLKKKAGA